MNQNLTLVTPTADCALGIKYLESFMQHQTARTRVEKWIVVDDGEIPSRCSAGQFHILRDRGDVTTTESFCLNLLEALPYIRTEFIAFIEHDDLYHPCHLEILLDQLKDPDILLAGDDLQRYYNVSSRSWKKFDNMGASLCQTGMRTSNIPTFEKAIRSCLKGNWRGVDAALWRMTAKQNWSLFRQEQVVGIKGLPGRPGIGMGHRPDETWFDDREMNVLRRWVGEENLFRYVDLYKGARVA